MMTPSIKMLALGGAALWSVMMIAATERDPPRPDASVPDLIQDRWPEPQLTELLRKSDRLWPAPLATPAGPAVVSPAAEPLPSPAVIQPITRARTSRHHAARDVCTRHGMRKVTTHGGRSWRCRRYA